VIKKHTIKIISQIEWMMVYFRV